MDQRKDRKIIVKLVCVLLSFALWLYVINVENPNRTVEIKNIPIKILNEDSLEKLGLCLSSKDELTTSIKIEGPATKVYSVSKKDFSLSLNLSDYALKEGKNIVPVNVNDYPEGINIKSGEVLSVKINIEKIVNKSFTLENKVDISYANNYSAASLVIEPSEVNVYGPKSVVNKVNSVAIVGNIKDISKDYSEYFEIRAFDKFGNIVSGIELSKSKAKLILSTYKHKEVSIKVNYTGTIDKRYSIVGEELDTTIINIFGDSNIINNIDEIETEPIDLSTINKNSEIECSLVLPEGVKTDKKTVKLNITVKDNTEEEEVEKTINAKINYSDKKEEFNYEGPETIAITVKGKKKDMDNINGDNILVKASLKDIVEIGDNISVQWNASLQGTTNISLVNTTGVVVVNVKTKA